MFIKHALFAHCGYTWSKHLYSIICKGPSTITKLIPLFSILIHQFSFVESTVVLTVISETLIKKKAVISYYHYQVSKIIYGCASASQWSNKTVYYFCQKFFYSKQSFFTGVSTLQDSPRKRLLVFYIIQQLHLIYRMKIISIVKIIKLQLSP
jgi:hypothetical protein